MSKIRIETTAGKKEKFVGLALFRHRVDLTELNIEINRSGADVIDTQGSSQVNLDKRGFG